MSNLSAVEQYAIDLVANGAESFREDDLNEDGAISEEKHPDAVKLAGDIVRAIQENPRAILDLTYLHAGRER